MRFPLASNRIRGNVINNTFGKVRKDKLGRPRSHQGWDFHAPVGTDVFAVAEGMIAYAETGGDLGNTVMQEISIGGQKRWAVYAHLDSRAVKKGDVVKEGALIGKTGITGNAKTMKGEDRHLHFEFRTKLVAGLGLGNRIDPKDVFGPPPMNTAVGPKVG
jgi:murein DD-endopeptidase MepM/ murein hydrolase activator NlpD